MPLLQSRAEVDNHLKLINIAAPGAQTPPAVFLPEMSYCLLPTAIMPIVSS